MVTAVAGLGSVALLTALMARADARGIHRAEMRVALVESLTHLFLAPGQDQRLRLLALGIAHAKQAGPQLVDEAVGISEPVGLDVVAAAHQLGRVLATGLGLLAGAIHGPAHELVAAVRCGGVQPAVLLRELQS